MGEAGGGELRAPGGRRAVSAKGPRNGVGGRAHNLDHEPVVGVGVGHEELDRREDGRQVERRLPRALGRHVEDVEANAAGRVNVRVVDGSGELRRRRGACGGGGGGEGVPCHDGVSGQTTAAQAGKAAAGGAAAAAPARAEARRGTAPARRAAGGSCPARTACPPPRGSLCARPVDVNRRGSLRAARVRPGALTGLNLKGAVLLGPGADARRRLAMQHVEFLAQAREGDSGRHWFAKGQRLEWWLVERGRPAFS